MLNASVGVQRVLGRLRRPQSDRRLERRAPARPGVTPSPPSCAMASDRWCCIASRADPRARAHAPSRPRSSSRASPLRRHRRSLIARLGPDRAVAVAVAAILVGASVISVSAGCPPRRDRWHERRRDGPPDRGRRWHYRRSVGPTEPTARRIRRLALAAGGATDSTVRPAASNSASRPRRPSPTRRSRPSTRRYGDRRDRRRRGRGPVPRRRHAAQAGRGRHDRPRRQRPGPDLQGQDRRHARRHRHASSSVSMMTVWWANNLKSKDDLKIGQMLTHPAGHRPHRHGQPRPTRSTASPRRYGVDGDRHPRDQRPRRPEPRRRPGPRLPGAKGKAIRRSPDQAVEPPATRAAAAAAVGISRPADLHRRHVRCGRSSVATTTSASTSTTATTRIDIAADYGTTVRAAAGGTVIFAGWKSNGGGYQVWIAHGSGLYTTYNHMSAISVGRGQHVGRGQQVGRVGQSGNATGPHLHFEVWRGPDLGRRPARQSARLPVEHFVRPVPGRPDRGAAPAACENGPDVPRPREDLGPRRRWRRRGRDLPAGGARPARRTRRRRRRPRRLGLPPGRCRPDDAARLPVPAPLPGDARRSRRRARGGTARPATTSILDVPPGTAVYDDETGALLADLVARRPDRDGRPRRPRRARQHPLQDLHPPGPEARPEGRAGRRALAPPRAPAHRRHRARRAAERRQVDAPRRPDRGHARRSPTTRSRRSSRTSASWTSATRTSGGRRSPTCPGLIEGASSGAGLGHAFLRHVERTRILVHVVDGSSRDPEWDYDVIREELRAHDPALLEKPMLVAFNKIDLPAAAEAWPAFRERARRRRAIEPVAISAATGEGLAAFRTRIADDPARRRRAGRAARAGRRRRPPHRGDGRRLQRRARRRRRLPGRGQADRADRRPDQLRRRGIGGALPARPGAPRHRCRAAAGRDRGRATLVRIGGDRARVGGAALGADVTAAPRPIVPGSLGVFGGTFDPIHVAPPGGRRGGRARRSGSSGSCSCRPASRRTSRGRRSRRPSTGWRWSSSRSPATTGSRSSRIELDRDGPSYTVDTLEDLRAARVAAGASPDLDADPVGRGVPRAADLARAAAGPRAGTGRGRAARRLPGRRPRRSSPNICPTSPTGRPSSTGRACASRRASCDARAAAGRSLRYLVPDAVAAYIGDHALYRAPPEDPPIVTEPAMPRPSTDPATAPRADGLPKRAKRRAGTRSARRSSSPGGSSSWPRTRRRPTSSCSTSPA